MTGAEVVSGAGEARPAKIAETVARDIRRRILAGELHPGDSLLTETEMMGLYGIARPTLREALRLLERDQLLEVRQGSHRGWRARLPEPSVAARSVTMLLELRSATLRDVYEARTIFEPPACRLAAERADDVGVERLRRTLEEEVAADSDRVAYPIVAWRFHTELAELSGNATLAVLCATLQHISESHASRAVAGRWDREMWAGAYRAHHKLVGLIAARRGGEAEAFWRRHMAAAGRQVLDEIGDLPIYEVL